MQWKRGGPIWRRARTRPSQVSAGDAEGLEIGKADDPEQGGHFQSSDAGGSEAAVSFLSGGSGQEALAGRLSPYGLE